MPYFFRNPDAAPESGEPGEGLWFDASTTAISLEYDLKNRAVIIGLTPQDEEDESSTHWWLDWDQKGLWKMQYGDPDQEPLCLHARKNFVAETVADSTVMWGGRNGYIYSLQNTANDDDGNEYESYIWFGPFGDPIAFNDTIITELVGILARNSGEIRWDIYVGETPEEAFNSTPRESGTWVAGRNYAAHPRSRGMAQYIKLTNIDETGWAFEQAYAVLNRAGRYRP